MENCSNHPNIVIKYDHKSLQLCELICLNTLLFQEKRGGVGTLLVIWFLMEILHINSEWYPLDSFIIDTTSGHHETIYYETA